MGSTTRGQPEKRGKETDTNKRNMRRNVITKGAKIGMAERGDVNVCDVIEDQKLCKGQEI